MAKTARDQYLEKLKKEREAADKARIQQNRYNNSQQGVYDNISAKLKDYDAEVRKYGDIYNSTFFDSNGKAKTGYLGNVGEQGKAATFQAANIVTKRRAVQDAVAKWSDYLDDDYKASIEKYFEDSNAELTKLNKDFQDSYNYYSQFKDEADYKIQLAEAEKYKNDEAARKKIAALEVEKAEIEKWLKNPQYMPLADTELKQETTPETRNRAIQAAQDRVLKGYQLALDDIDAQIRDLQNKHFPGEVRTWFNTDAFDNGVAKSIYATGQDIRSNIAGGLLDLGEGIVDTGAYVANAIARLTGTNDMGDVADILGSIARVTGADKNKTISAFLSTLEGMDLEDQKVQDYITNFIKKDLYNGADVARKIYDPFGLAPKENSFLGEKTRGVLQSGGQLAGTTAISALSGGVVPWWVTTGASTFGGEVEQALNQGASLAQAGASGLVSAGAEILSEKLSGGISFGGGTLDDIVLYPLLDQISNKVVKALAKTGADALGEGFEEIFSGVISNLGTALYREESLEDILMSEEALDEYVESFVGGAVLGGGIGGVNAATDAARNAYEAYKRGTAINEAEGATDKLVALGRTIPEAAKLSEKVAGKPSAYKTGRLYETVRDSVTPENEEGARSLAEIEESVYNPVFASSAVSKEAADRINTAFTTAIDATPLPESVKAAVARDFILPDNIDPNSAEAEQYARDLAEDAATAYEAGYIQQRDGSRLKEGQLEELISVATPDQIKYYSDLGRERALSEAVEGDTRTYTADIPKRIEARKTFLARSADEVKAATKADKTLTAEQKRAAEFGESIGVAVGFADTTQYYPTKRDGFSLKNKGVIILDRNTKDPLKQVFIHELTHFSETAKSYEKLKKFVMDSKTLDKWLTEKGYTGSTINKRSAYRSAKKKDYSENGVDLTKEGADAEMIANFLGETIGTEERFNAFMEELTSEQKKTFLEWLADIWNKIFGKNKVPAELRHIERLYKKALTEAGDEGKKGKNSRTEKTVDFSITSKLSKDDIRKNIDKVIHMSPVSELTGNEFKKSEISLIDQVEAYFDSFNNAVLSKYGSVELTRKGIKSSVGHGIGRNKAVAFKAVPDVIKYGEIIDYQINWKERGYDTAVFAAPIKIKGIDYYLAAVIIVEKSRNAYYLHEIALQKKEDTAMFKTGTDKNGTSGKAISPILMLLQKLQNVNRENPVTENEQFSIGDINPVTETENKELEKHFGTTGNFNVAGYLLTDGKLLDFSGKHWGDTTSRTRQVDHRDVQEVLNRGNNGIDDMVSMIGSGNIRLMPENGGINLAVYPNEKQRRVLSSYINYMLNINGEVVIDYDAVGGDTVYSKVYGKTATSRQILNDIRNYFNGARPSELMSFHTDEQFAIPEQKSIDINDLSSEAGEQVNKNSRKFDEAFINDTLRSFGITKPKDYIHVQRQVLSTLVEEGFFTNKETRSRVDINQASDMVIETNKKSIEKTFSESTYKNVGMDKKIAKLATIRLIPEIISNGVVVKDNVRNQYGDADNKTFAYIEGNVITGNRQIQLKLDVKKSRQKNKFYVHNIVNIENIISLSDGTDAVQGRAQLTDDVGKTIPQPDENVKGQFSIPENGLTPRVEEKGESIPERTRRLEQRFADGEIEYDELVRAEAELMNEAREKYGVIEEGENAEVEANVPTAVENNKVNSKYVRTILETGAVSDALARQLGAKTLLGDFSHEVISDKAALKEAELAIKQNTAKNMWGKTVESIHSLPSKNNLAIGEKLLAKAMNEGKSAEALEIASDLVDVYTRAGQLVQSASLLKKMTGTGRLVHLQRTVNRINKDIGKKHKTFAPIKIGESLARELVEAKTPEEVDDIAREIEQDVANQLPVTWLDKWNAWRYLSMLGNPLTHFRNITGNGIFLPTVMLQRVIGTGLEKLISPQKRTRALIVDQQYKDFAKKDVKNEDVQQILDGTDKMTGDTKLMRERRIFKNRVLNYLSTTNKNLLSAEDALFKNWYYQTALSGFLQARNVDLDTLNEDELIEARTFAVSEALKSTYNDVSQIALVLKELESKNTLASILVNGLVPFKQTPINIVKRGVEYSPIGLVTSLTKGIYDLKQNKITASEFINGVSAGASGTIVFSIGLLLASLGWVSGGFGDDDEDKFRQLAGEQEYSLQVFGKSYTLDWAAPISIPFFIGVELVNAIRKKDEGFTLQDFTEVFWNSLDPVVNMSMLSGIENAISSIRNADGAEMVGTLAENIVSSYFGQAIPTIGGKIANLTDELRRSNYIDKNSQIPSFLQRMYNSAIAKMPGLSDNRNPYIDAWGRTVSQGGGIERFLESFISPGYFSKVEYEDVDLKLLELYEKTGETIVLPDSAAKYFTVNGERKDLTADEYVKYATNKGRYSFEYIKEFFDSDISKTMTPEEQVKAIRNIYEYANDKAKASISDYDIDKNNKTAHAEEKRGNSVVDYYAQKVIAERYAPSLYNEAMDKGNTEEAERLKADIIAWKQENGKNKREAESELKQSIKNYWKDKYIDAYIDGDSAQMQRIQSILKDTGYFPNPKAVTHEWYTDYLKKKREEQKKG